MLTRHPERRESVLDRHEVLAEEEFSHTAAFGISPAMFKWIDHYPGEGIDEVARGYIAIRRSDRLGTRIMTVPIERAIRRDIGAGVVKELLQRVEAASSHPLSELRFSPRFHPGNVQQLLEGADPTQATLSYLVVNGLLAAARPDGTISLGALLAAFREAGHEVGPRRREDLERILRQLYVSGYLDSADESGEAPAAPVGEHETAMKMWWSR
jgi:hypothetical protein